MIKNIILTTLCLLLFIPLAMLNGWAISTLWGWFIVPVFHLSLLTMKQAIGFGLVISYLTSTPAHAATQKKETKDQFTNTLIIIVYNITKPLLAVAVGWVYLKVFF